MVGGIIHLFTFPFSRIDLKQGTEEVLNKQNVLENSDDCERAVKDRSTQACLMIWAGFQQVERLSAN